MTRGTVQMQRAINLARPKIEVFVKLPEFARAGQAKVDANCKPVENHSSAGKSKDLQSPKASRASTLAAMKKVRKPFLKSFRCTGKLRSSGQSRKASAPSASLPSTAKVARVKGKSLRTKAADNSSEDSSESSEDSSADESSQDSYEATEAAPSAASQPTEALRSVVGKAKAGFGIAKGCKTKELCTDASIDTGSKVLRMPRRPRNALRPYIRSSKAATASDGAACKSDVACAAAATSTCQASCPSAHVSSNVMEMKQLKLEFRPSERLLPSAHPSEERTPSGSNVDKPFGTSAIVKPLKAKRSYASPWLALGEAKGDDLLPKAGQTEVAESKCPKVKHLKVKRGRSKDLRTSTDLGNTTAMTGSVETSFMEEVSPLSKHPDDGNVKCGATTKRVRRTAKADRARGRVSPERSRSPEAGCHLSHQETSPRVGAEVEFRGFQGCTIAEIGEDGSIQVDVPELGRYRVNLAVEGRCKPKVSEHGVRVEAMVDAAAVAGA